MKNFSDFRFEFLRKEGVKLAKTRKKNRKPKDSYQRRFEYSDLAWLAEQFQKQQSILNPDLTVEEFAILVMAYIPKRFIVLLMLP